MRSQVRVLTLGSNNLHTFFLWFFWVLTIECWYLFLHLSQYITLIIFFIRRLFGCKIVLKSVNNEAAYFQHSLIGSSDLIRCSVTCSVVYAPLNNLRANDLNNVQFYTRLRYYKSINFRIIYRQNYEDRMASNMRMNDLLCDDMKYVVFPLDADILS